MCRFRFSRARDHLFLCAGLVKKFLLATHWLPASRGWDAPLGWENLSSISRPILYFAPQHTVNRTMCRFRFPRARQSVSMCRAGPKVSVSYSLTSSSTRVGCTAGLGELEQQIAGPFYTCSTTHCKQNYVPLSFSNGQGPSVSMRRADRKVSVSGSLTSNSLFACHCTVQICVWVFSLGFRSPSRHCCMEICQSLAQTMRIWWLG